MVRRRRLCRAHSCIYHGLFLRSLLPSSSSFYTTGVERLATLRLSPPSIELDEPANGSSSPLLRHPTSSQCARASNERHNTCDDLCILFCTSSVSLHPLPLLRSSQFFASAPASFPSFSALPSFPSTTGAAAAAPFFA